VRIEHTGILRVHDQQRAQPRDLEEGVVELPGVEVRELVHTRGCEEALEPEDAAFVQFGQAAEARRHRAAPEPDVDDGLWRGDRALHVEGGGIHGGGDAVERHVDDRRDPAGGRGTGRAREALPLGAAGLVDVHVGVDEAGQQHGAGGEAHARARSARIRPGVSRAQRIRAQRIRSGRRCATCRAPSSVDTIQTDRVGASRRADGRSRRSDRSRAHEQTPGQAFEGRHECERHECDRRDCHRARRRPRHGERHEQQ
jgi:hypothetical protein